jgi:hypothetical protein
MLLFGNGKYHSTPLNRPIETILFSDKIKKINMFEWV